MIKIVIFILCFVVVIPAVASDYYDWNIRADRDGKPAGIMTSTPFPVDETMLSYSITNDEGTKTFNLGTIYFVDGTTTGCTDGSTNYDPATRACGSGYQTVYTTIARGISAVSAGNKTILIRNGVYNESGLTARSGTDDTHRYMLIGYKQERPVIDHGSGAFGINANGNYTTLQRLTSRYADETNIYVGNSRYINLIDVYSYWGNDNKAISSDGSIRAQNSSYLWNYHVTVERTYGHCIKMSDGANNSLTEWSVVKECGWWPGETVAILGHASGYDYPDTGANHELRYSIVDTVLFNAIQVRGNTTYGPNGVGLVKIHHNEIVSATHFEDVTGEKSHDTPAMIIFNQGYTGLAIPNEIYFYGNIVRDSADSDARGLRIYSTYDNIYIYNNMFYNNRHNQIEITSAASSTPIKIWNNLFFGNNANVLVNVANGITTEIKNNIIYQTGTGSCMSVGTATHTYTILYAPYGSIGITLGVGEKNTNPIISIPSGAYTAGKGAILFGSPAIESGTDLSSSFTSAFNNATRPQGAAWDIGAYEYISGYTPLTPMPPSGITIR